MFKGRRCTWPMHFQNSKLEAKQGSCQFTLLMHAAPEARLQQIMEAQEEDPCL